MNCRMYQPWMSNNIDGVLEESKKRQLERHLESCASCRAMRENYRRFQDEAERLAKPELSPEYWRNFTVRLEKKIRLIPVEKRDVRFAPFRWYWAWMGAGMTAVIALGVLLMVSRQSLNRENYIFSMEDSIQNLYERIGDNEELEQTFDSLLQNAIDEAAGTKGITTLHFLDDPFIWDTLSDEDVRVLEKSIKNENP